MSLLGELWSVFSRIRAEYGEILHISLYSVLMQENTDQKISEYGHFPRSEAVYNSTKQALNGSKKKYMIYMTVHCSIPESN